MRHYCEKQLLIPTSKSQGIVLFHSFEKALFLGMQHYYVVRETMFSRCLKYLAYKGGAMYYCLRL